MANLHREMSSLFDENFRSWRGAETLARWAPAVDIHEKDNAIVLSAELPGMAMEDIDVEVHGGVLTIRGEKKFENEAKEENYHIVERQYGSFERSFTLPTTVNADDVKAAYKAGVLEVTLPKVEAAKPKKVSIDAN
jgi:HSP20 family protein